MGARRRRGEREGGWETLNALTKVHGKLPETLVVRTPSGGYHYYWTYPKGVEIHNSASNRLGPGLDVRATGGQVNAPPTSRKSGGYCWHRGRGPYDTEVTEAPAWLLELVVDAPRAPTPSLSLVSDVNKTLLDAPGFVNEYNERTTWAQVLEGWTLAYEQDGVTYWRRPGKGDREGISASANYAGTGCLYVWTTSIPWLPAERMYDRYGFMVHRDHGGDFNAAARHFVAASPQKTGEDLLAILPAARDNDEETGGGTEEQSRLEQAEMRLDSAEFWDSDQRRGVPTVAVPRPGQGACIVRRGEGWKVLRRPPGHCCSQRTRTFVVGRSS